MNRTIPFIAAALVIVGCGGAGGGTTGPQTSVLTGQVLDIDNNPVRGAEVKADGKTTLTSTTGTFVLEDLRSGKLEVVATIRDNGVNYIGQTFATVSTNEKRSNVNILVGAQGSLGAIRGVVRDRSGFVLRNVPVFAYNGSGSSARDFTDNNGEYSLENLIGGANYEVMATGQGYRSDTDTVTVIADDNVFVDLVLGNPGTPGLTAPQNLDVATWVSPYLTRSSAANPLEWARKNAFPTEWKPGRKFAASRAIRDDYAVEADLTWDEQRFADHLGWGIYKGVGASGSLAGLEFDSDPLAAFFQEVGLNVNSTYRYAVTTLSTEYPDRPNFDESDLSDIVTAKTLNTLKMNAPTGSPYRFSWTAGSGATEYVVYVFDQSPLIGVTEIWRSDFVTGTSVNYTGPAMTAGRRYYAFVLGLANSRSSRTLSEIEEFIR